ncbi:MAG: hypothetical protein FVQ80_14135 [Planctomycetes bacterium]|nr:hypothetical protein [Planctomycetota bacterium]
MTPKSGQNGKGQTYHYYQCTKNNHRGKKGCNVRYVPAKALEDMIVKYLKKLASNNEAIAEIVKKANASSDETLSKLKIDKENCQREFNNIRTKINSIVDAIESKGKETFKSLADRLSKLEGQEESLKDELEKISFDTRKVKTQTLSSKAMIQAYESLPELLDKFKKNPEQLKSLIPSVIEVIEWEEDPEDPGSGEFRIGYFEQPMLINKESLANKVVNNVRQAVLTGSPVWT